MSVRALMLAFASAPPGQVEFTTQGVHTWVVPDAVERLCMVAVQGAVIGAASATVVTIAGTVVCRAQNGNRIGTGGGNGGAGASPASAGNPWVRHGGGGGAGGYSGNGGNGGCPVAAEATAGAGGGGGGGGAGNSGGGWAGSGGGVGLKGQGSNGAPGETGTAGGAGSGGVGTLYGGGPHTSGANMRAGDGGALSYTNDVLVTPGQTVQINIGSPCGAVRLIWGDGRAYPSTNTGDA